VSSSGGPAIHADVCVHDHHGRRFADSANDNAIRVDGTPTDQLMYLLEHTPTGISLALNDLTGGLFGFELGVRGVMAGPIIKLGSTGDAVKWAQR
jgi:hypothetical protein